MELHRDDGDVQATGYPWDLPAIVALADRLPLHPHVTYLIGENGSGKSTLLEAIAVAAGMNAEGGSSNFAFSTRASHSELWRSVRLVRGARRPATDFFRDRLRLYPGRVHPPRTPGGPVGQARAPCRGGADRQP